MTIALVFAVGVGQGPSLNFFGEAAAAVPQRNVEKVQAARAPSPSVELVFLPSGTTVKELAEAGLSPGVMSAGLGKVPAEQTYLDITQGNRVFDSLYDRQLPSVRAAGGCDAWRQAVVERADSAPADIVPGLLGRTLHDAGVKVVAGARAACAFSASQTRTAAAVSPKKSREGPRHNLSPVLEVRSSSMAALSSLTRRLRGEGLLIAIARPTGESDEPVAIGIAGDGFHGNLTSDSTRTNGYVLSTDVAPTILERLGIDIPSQMSGQPIRSEGTVDPAAIEALVARMNVVDPRRGPVIGLSILAWVVALLLAVAAGRGAAAPTAVRIVGLSIVYLPLLLLLGAALEPSELAEALLVALGAPLLAGATLRALSGYRALAFASAVTVLAYAIDVIAGSPLSSLSLLGPNPGLGVRFYGIGNELEALLAVLVVAGSGAALAGFAPRLSARAGAGAFLGVALPLALVFASGRFGADVGAAIVLPIGAAVAAALVAGGRHRAWLLVAAVPLAMVALLALADLVSGANAHLTRSVLDAGGLGDLADVAQRRLQLSAHSFTRPVVLAFMPLVVLFAVMAVCRRRQIDAWVKDRAAVRAGLLGSVAATLAGALANDSGALLLEIGAVYLLVFIAYAWAQDAAERRPGRNRTIDYP